MTGREFTARWLLDGVMESYVDVVFTGGRLLGAPAPMMTITEYRAGAVLRSVTLPLDAVLDTWPTIHLMMHRLARLDDEEERRRAGGLATP